MVVIKWFCDRCRKEVNRTELGRIVVYESIDDTEVLESMDLCKECRERIRDAMSTTRLLL